MDITIKCPEVEHIEQLIILNSKYNYQHLSQEELVRGFIRIPYTYEQFQRLIEQKEITVALFNNQVVGYYLVGKHTQNPTLEYQIQKAKQIERIHQIDFERIGYGCQVCIETEFRNMNLFADMLSILVMLVRYKYDILLCSISDYNPASLRAHQKNNWKFYDKENSTNFLYHQIKEIELI